MTAAQRRARLLNRDDAGAEARRRKRGLTAATPTAPRVTDFESGTYARAKCTCAAPRSVAGGLTAGPGRDMLKCMRCLNFAVVASVLVTSPTDAQRVPGRDLLQYPIGALAEPQGLALDAGDGFQNPASVLLPVGTRLRASVTALNTGREQGLAGQLATVAIAIPQGATVAISAARASVEDIGFTEVNPEPIGRDVPYSTFVLSLVAARRTLEHLSSGLAVRYRAGELEGTRRSTVGLDAGLVLEEVLGYDARIGVSSFLWSPGGGGERETSISGAADARVFGPDSLRNARVGYAYTYAERLPREHFLFAAGRLSRLTARAGVARTTGFGEHLTRLRLGIGLRYARYHVILSREDSPDGFAPTYQFSLNGLFR